MLGCKFNDRSYPSQGASCVIHGYNVAHSSMVKLRYIINLCIKHFFALKKRLFFLNKKKKLQNLTKMMTSKVFSKESVERSVMKNQ